MNEQQHTGRVRDATTHPAWWIIAISLAVIAFNMTFRSEEVLSPAIAQSVRSAGARGIFAFSGQLTPSTFGLYMVDVDAGTIWCYEYIMVGGVKRLRLVSARSWIFDRYLEEYNVDGLTPADVQNMVEQQRGKSADQESSSKP